MSSSKYVQTARRLIRENADLFDALLEFERTKRMPKLKRKMRANFTLDADLFRAFRRECEHRRVKMSNLVEKAILEQLKKWR